MIVVDEVEEAAAAAVRCPSRVLENTSPSTKVAVSTIHYIIACCADETTTPGANFNNISRIELMQKLSRSERPADIVLPPVFVPASPLSP